MTELTLFEAMEQLGAQTADAVSRSVSHDCGAGVPMEFMRTLQAEMMEKALSAGLPKTPVVVDEMFADNLYARRYSMPAGQLAVTKIHKKKHFIVVIGDCTIWTEDVQKRLVGFHCFITHPGTKRVITAHADTVFITFHATALTDTNEIEAELIEPEDIFEEVVT